MFTFASSLPSYSGVGLTDQGDGQIQSVVRELVLRIGAKTRQKTRSEVGATQRDRRVFGLNQRVKILTFLPELKTAGCRFLPRADWCQKSLQNDTVERKMCLFQPERVFQRMGGSAMVHAGVMWGHVCRPG